MNLLLQLASIALVIISANSFAQEAKTPQHELTLAEALQLAEKVSPGLKAASERETQADLSITIAKSNLLPKLDLSAADSWGFPGSSSPVPPPFGGLLTSPFRVGGTAALLGQMTIFDLSHWHGLDEAKENAHVAAEQIRISRTLVDQDTIDLFFEAATYRGESEVWRKITDKLVPIFKSVSKLVKNGQYSEVQRLLLEDQLTEAQMKNAVAWSRYKMTKKRLALLLDLPSSSIECPSALLLNDANLGTIEEGTKSPLISHAEAEITAAKLAVSKFSAEHLPKLYAVGSAGFMESSRLVNKEDYSAWIGLTLPLFEGFRINAEAERAKVVANEKEDNFYAARLTLDELNTHYDDLIQAARIQLDFLTHERTQAIQTFELTRKRYLSFLEPVLNLKEAVKNLARIESQTNEVKSSLYRAKSSKLILNGGAILGHDLSKKLQ